MKQNSSSNRGLAENSDRPSEYPVKGIAKTGVSGLKTDAPGTDLGAQHASEAAVAIRQIASAFVDLGFGSSATQQALHTANSNRSLRAVVELFHRDAS